MKALLACTCAVAALILVAPASHADSTPAAPTTTTEFDQSALAAPTLQFAQPVAPQPTLELVHLTVPDEQVLGVHYRPRSRGWGHGYDLGSYSQVHVGFFDPEGAPGSEFLLGIRGGPMVAPNLQLGVGVDWSHLTDNNTVVSRDSVLPGGQTISVQTDMSRATTNLFPIMAFAQVSGDENMPVIPYFGASVAYEVMNLTADNFQTGESFDATYGGWGWQAWAGIGLPLSGQARINGEVFVNTAELGRDVNDNFGNTVRETVKANGLGARIGMAWGF